MAPVHNISISAADEVADSEGTNGGPSGRDTAASEDSQLSLSMTTRN